MNSLTKIPTLLKLKSYKNKHIALSDIQGTCK